MAISWGLDVITGRKTLDQIQRALDDFWDVYSHIPELVRMQMTIASAEVAGNIVEHSAMGEPVRMRMEVRAFPNRIQIDFLDDGHPADVDLAGVSMPGEWADRGRGLALAQAVLDRLSYHRTRIGNRWTLLSAAFSGIPAGEAA